MTIDLADIRRLLLCFDRYDRTVKRAGTRSVDGFAAGPSDGGSGVISMA
jgi:hypothetical protein